MSELPAIATTQDQLIGRKALINEIMQGVDQGRRVFALEGITGVGKTAALAAVVVELDRRKYCPAVLNAVEQASEDLAIATIYNQLKSLPQDPEAVINALAQRLTDNAPKVVRAIAGALMADMAKLATDKFGKTIDLAQQLVSGDLLSSPVGEALDAVQASNKRLFLTRFLDALAEAGTLVVISIDNVDQTNLPEFIRFLISSKPPSLVLLLAHNTERGDNGRWDNIVSDAKAGKGLQITVEPLGRGEIHAWFLRDVGRAPTSAECDRLLQVTGGRPQELVEAIEAVANGVDPIAGDFSGYYVTRRQAIAGDARAVAELLAIIPYDATVAVDLLERAAARIGCANIGPAIDQLLKERLLKNSASRLALSHALVQDTWREGIADQRWADLVGGWHEAYSHFNPSQLTGPDATAIIPVIRTLLVEATPAAEVVEAGAQLLKAGQLQVGLELVDSGWQVGSATEKGSEDMLQHALLAAKTRLDLGRYSEVDEPLAQAERSTNKDTRVAALLLRMKLALRRNTYVVLWKLAKDLDGLTDCPSEQAEIQAILNVAFRDLGDAEGIRATTDKLIVLREQLVAEQQMSIDRSIARALAKLEDVEGAEEVAERALASASEIGTARDIGNAYLARAEVRRYGRRYAEALADYHQAEAFGRGIGNRDSQLWSLLGAAAAQIESGDPKAARVTLEEVSALLSEPGYAHPIETAHAQLLRALAGEAVDIEKLLRKYEDLGIRWPRGIFDQHSATGSLAGPTPL